GAVPGAVAVPGGGGGRPRDAAVLGPGADDDLRGLLPQRGGAATDEPRAGGSVRVAGPGDVSHPAVGAGPGRAAAGAHRVGGARALAPRGSVRAVVRPRGGERRGADAAQGGADAGAGAGGAGPAAAGERGERRRVGPVDAGRGGAGRVAGRAAV